MVHIFRFGLMAVWLWGLAGFASAQPGPGAPPLTYEVVINGESFQVEGNRKVKLQSKEKPGTTYEIAVRVSPSQHLRLSSIELDYDLPARVADDGEQHIRTVRIKHELGFTLTITDLGEAVGAEKREKVLDELKGSAVKFCDQRNGQAMKVGDLRDAEFQGAAARGLKVHFQDFTLSLDPREDVGHTCFAWVLYGPKFTASCLIEYPDKFSGDCVPVIRKVLDSIRPLP
ncbi:MAG: hypothetical protein ABR915_21125 [Thermoguttaceae bacterium]|jgi:hypothetical protein